MERGLMCVCSRMVNFAVAVFMVLGGIAKVLPFDDL
jgi:hypothetical protein